MNWTANIDRLYTGLKSLDVTDKVGRHIQIDEAFLRWRDRTLEIRRNRKTVYLIGNGASASMASHMAADLAKNAHVHTEVFSDLSLITAVANDLCYEEVFSEPLRRRMKPGDMLVAISSSGNSPNILRAADTAIALEGQVATLSAMKLDNRLRSKGDLNFYVPAETYGMAESGHAAILHYWMDLVSNVSNQE
jgi:D-sedoheptulose 7-phosphate isomerase